MIHVVAVRLSGGVTHQHIVSVRWIDPATGIWGESTREAMVDWIRNHGGDARVRDQVGEVQVGVVMAVPPYLRAHVDGRWSDDLLTLPRY